MSRRSDRKHAFSLVFQLPFYQTLEMDEAIDYYLGEWAQQTTDGDFVRQEVHGVLGHLAEIDAAIGSKTMGWTIDRLSKTDLAILRLAVFEMLFTEIPSSVSANEAVELAKEFSQDESPAFINGILGNIEAMTRKNE